MPQKLQQVRYLVKVEIFNVTELGIEKWFHLYVINWFSVKQSMGFNEIMNAVSKNGVVINGSS